MFPGRLIADRYRVLRVLGRGGMGVVSEVEAIATGQRFAIKFLRDDVGSDVQPSARFLREAKLATRLTSPHVCRVTEIGEWELGPYLVMDLLEGRSLSAILEDKVAISWQQTVRIAYEACNALGEAHQRGIVHRDVKPGNIFIAKHPDGQAMTKVLDFGVAKIPGSVVTTHGDRSLTDASTLLGTPSYVSPEQLMNSKLVDARADIWAIGVLMYEMLSGRLPFASPLVPKLLVMIARDEPAPLSTLAPAVPSHVVEIVHRCLRKLPDERFDDALTLAQALDPWLDRTPDLLAPLLVYPSKQISLGPSGPPVTMPPLCEATQAEPSNSERVLAAKEAEPNQLELIEQRRRLRVRYLLVGAGLGLMGAVVYFVARAAFDLHGQSVDSSSATPASSESVAHHSILILVDPAQSRLQLDGRHVPEHPAQLTGADDGETHQLVISSPGYRTEVRTLRFDKDQQLSLSLIKESPSTPLSSSDAAKDPSQAAKASSEVKTSLDAAKSSSVDSSHRARSTPPPRVTPNTGATRTRQLDTDNPF